MPEDGLPVILRTSPMSPDANPPPVFGQTRRAYFYWDGFSPQAWARHSNALSA